MNTDTGFRYLLRGGLLLTGIAFVSCVQRPNAKRSLPPLQLYDRILGGLLGSAAGDAMGAPTEMWSREAIQAEYGHVDSLDDMVRDPSAEGTWKWNLPAGGTTDDTRWKKLVIEAFLSNSDSPARSLASAIVQEHDEAIGRMQEGQTLDSDYYADQLRQAQWLSEWVKVARPYLAGDRELYDDALHSFYGGEMVCAGMIYAPAVGLRYPNDPERAYRVTYETDIYDLGYARDMAGLVAAMVSAAMDSSANGDSALSVIRSVDPKGYFRARLVSRTAYKLYQRTLQITKLANEVDTTAFFASQPAVRLQLPIKTAAERLKYARWSTAYELLDEELRRMPFHPDEIWMVTLTGMLMGEFDLQESLAFIVNYGRDNDTSAAMAGAIIGAMTGADAFPEAWKTTILETSLELDLDFEDLARRLTDQIIQSPS